ncbi:MAG: Trk system potassium transporter TrkA [Pseudomonadota bacterium]
MRIIVCGAGQVGFQIARQLASENNDVVMIDLNEALIAKITETLDVRGVAGFASSPSVLQQAGAADADMLIAATHSDEVNMVACQVAHTMFSVPRKIARVRRQDYLIPQWRDLFRRDHMPIDVVISPEIEVARVVVRRLNSPSAFDSASFLDERVRVVGARLPAESAIAQTQLRQLSELFPHLNARILAYVREGRLRRAGGDDQLFEGDEVYFIAQADHVNRMLSLLGRSSDAAARVVLVGGGNIGVQVAQTIEASGARAKLIERDRARAERAAEALERTIVIHGDGLDQEILAEANVVDAQAIVALTEDDKVNVLSCALAKVMGCPRAVALTNDPSFGPLAGPLAIDAFVNPRATTVSTILRHVRRGRIRALHSLREGEGEILEAQVLATSPMAGRRLRDVELPSGAVVGAVLSGSGALRMPTGDLTVEAGDIVVMFALKRDVRQVEQLFRVSLEFF